MNFKEQHGAPDGVPRAGREMQCGSSDLQSQAGEDEPDIWSSSCQSSSSACKRV